MLKLTLLYDDKVDMWYVKEFKESLFGRDTVPTKWSSLHEAMNKIREMYPNCSVKLVEVGQDFVVLVNEI